MVKEKAQRGRLHAKVGCRLFDPVFILGEKSLEEGGRIRHDHLFFSLFAGTCQIGLSLALGNLSFHPGIGQRGLHVGLRLDLVERPQLLGRRFLPLERLELFD